jgi:endonuclease III
MRGAESADTAVNYDIGRQVVASQIPGNFNARKRAYLLLQRHGEVMCKPDQPNCEDCPVNLNCIYFTERSNSPQSRGTTID